MQDQAYFSNNALHSLFLEITVSANRRTKFPLRLRFRRAKMQKNLTILSGIVLRG